MRYVHFDLNKLRRGSRVRVELTGTPANVLLLDSLNFSSYKRGSAYRHYGGHFKRSPATLVVPEDGHWHVIVNNGGYAGRGSAAVRVEIPLG